MDRKVYNWERYWVPREGAFSFDYDGFLLRPPDDARWRSTSRTGALKFEDIDSIPCLILLGEPGIGKTFAVNAHVARRSSMHLNLGSYGSEQRLIDDWFGSAQFHSWVSNGGELHMFLDSFDECLLRLDNVAALLAEEIRKLKDTRGLFFRIASRTAEWRTALELAFRQRWGDDQVGAYELAPLTRDQVRSAAATEEIAADSFVQAAMDREVVSFAIKPLTLGLLFRIWKARRGALPPTQKEIYEQGCTELCSDFNPDRDTPQLRRQLSAGQRVAIASHIAAATIFCKRAVISTANRPAMLLETDLSLADLAQGEVRTQQSALPVTIEYLRETFDTGLFTARGPDRLGWAHQTYAEFLASRYLEQQHVSTRQILSLIQHPLDPERKLVPQLHETAAWIASNRPPVFDAVLRTDSETLLRSDVGTADDSTKRELVDAVLNGADNPKFSSDWWKLRARYRKLCYCGLARQLAQRLQQPKESAATKIEAIDMIEACELHSVTSVLARLALVTSEDMTVRVRAADVVSRLGSDGVKRQLRPLALSKLGALTSEDLFGAALTPCWPKFLTTRELFRVLKEPDENGTSRYSLFLRDDKLVSSIPAKDMPVALRWAEMQKRHRRLFSHASLIHRIIARGAASIDQPKIRAAFVPALLSRLDKHDYGTGEDAQQLNALLDRDTQLRRACIEVAIEHFKDPFHYAFLITNWGVALARLADLGWLLDRLLSEESAKKRIKLCEVIRRIFYPASASIVETLVDAAQHCAELRETMSFCLDPIVLDSDAGLKLKADWDREQEWKRNLAEEQREPPPLDPPPAQRIRDLLNRVDQGEIDLWWQISRWSEIQDNGRSQHTSREVDIRKLQGWQKADEPTRGRLLSAAELYLRNYKGDASVWFAKRNVLHFPMVAGLRALFLLKHEKQSVFDELTMDTWRRWAAAIVRHQYYNEIEAFRELVSAAMHKVPDEVIQEILTVVDTENRESETLFILDSLGKEFDQPIGTALLHHLQKASGLKASSVTQLLSKSVTANVPGAIDEVRRRLPAKPPKQKSRRAIALTAMGLLLVHGNRGDWLRLWKLLQADPEFARNAFERFAYEHDYLTPPILDTISPHEFGLLWEWMLQQYPVAEDPDRSRGGTVTPRWAIAELRDNIMWSLAQRGTAEACDEIRRLQTSYPQFDWFPRLLARGIEQTRRNTWQPLTPSQLFELASDQKKRLIQNADQLLEVVCDALSAIQEKLHAETPAAPFLWDGHRPKKEEAVSDWVKIELDGLLIAKGIVINREVQIHVGERTDVHIDAVSREGPAAEFGREKVIIEVKGCWNSDQKTAMKQQLVDHYLTNNDCTHGIFLLAWFLCNTWMPTDSRKIKVPFRTRASAERFFAKQAEVLSVKPLSLKAFVLDATISRTRSRRIHARRKGGSAVTNKRAAIRARR